MSKKSKKILCPECKNSQIWKDGIRHTRNGEVQRYICRSCGFRFSESTTNRQVKVNIAGQILEEPNSGKNFPEADILQRDLSLQPIVQNLPFQGGEDVGSHHRSKVTIVEKGLNRFRDYNSDCQVCASRKGVKNLVEVKSRIEKRAAGATKPDEADVKGKIVEFAFKLKKDGYKETTIESYITVLKTLARKGTNLFDPESVKETIANQPLSETTKRNYVNTYDAFAKIMGFYWKKPNYKPNERIPFIPLESEIDQLIYSSGQKLSVVLRIAKETAMRIGEIVRLRWIDVDPKNNVIVINNPEKGSKAGIYNVSRELMSMIMSLPKTSERIFPTSVKPLVSRFGQTRKRLARKYNNPRLLRITFHTLRHWKATMEYHKTKDILHVKELLRHRRIENTMIYINLEKLLFKSENSEEFHVKVAKNIDEACELVKVGFEYVTEYSNGKIFRKRK